MSKRNGEKPREFEVVLRRVKGDRFVKNSLPQSRYKAKQLRKAWEEKYDSSYYVEVRDADTHELV